ncbi:MAG: molybdate ABC transporter substrate-binding protein [Alphaproteobacteria bacterium]
MVLAAASTARAETLLVFAASSLADALPEVARAWRAAGGSEVDFSFAGSGDLARQVEQGAPADVFFSADEAQVDRLARAGLLDDATRRDVLSNRLVVIVPAESEARVAAAADLASFDRVALANPESVPAGVYARAWLERTGAWDAVAAKVVPVLDARAALAAVAEGHAPAAVVFATDAVSNRRVRVALEVPPTQAPKITYPLAVLRRSRHARARELADFLASPAALRIYERHGFPVAARP